MEIAGTTKPMNKQGEEMLWQDWTGEIHTYLSHIRYGIWVLVALEAIKFIVW